MGMEYWISIISANTKECLKTGNSVDKESFTYMIEAHIMESLAKDKDMDLVYSFIKIRTYMKGNDCIMRCTAMVLNTLIMETHTKENGFKGK
mmetsp:Transcript_4185/g.554  ORF Transcript_4185/g.554 Transcript_4185/m.554 type:complete len:92 (-) Transcript_4185:225-500(-)